MVFYVRPAWWGGIGERNQSINCLRIQLRQLIETHYLSTSLYPFLHPSTKIKKIKSSSVFLSSFLVLFTKPYTTFRKSIALRRTTAYLM